MIQPADPKTALEETEASLAAVDELQKAGIFKEVGTFNPGEGFIIAFCHKLYIYLIGTPHAFLITKNIIL